MRHFLKYLNAIISFIHWTHRDYVGDSVTRSQDHTKDVLFFGHQLITGIVYIYEGKQRIEYTSLGNTTDNFTTACNSFTHVLERTSMKNDCNHFNKKPEILQAFNHTQVPVKHKVEKFCTFSVRYISLNFLTGELLSGSRVQFFELFRLHGSLKLHEID